MAAQTAAELQPVIQVTERLLALLAKARTIKPESTVEPPLPVSEFVPDVDALLDDVELDEGHDLAFRSHIVETAVRQTFFNLVNSADIQGPEFVGVWNLIDVVTICTDNGVCAPEVLGYLIEDLLDSQTTTGCRVVFDYMESRSSRLAAKDFHKKNLIFLRACNELLRRLSRAEDAIFCGRVFFFLFQTFPLGDKSSVNLRGEFHAENTTKFEVSEQENEEMDLDDIENVKAETPQPPSKPGQKAIQPKAVKKTVEEKVLSSSELYPIFWRLQQDFSEPTRLHTPNHFARFKKALNYTITKFKKTPVVQTRNDADSKRGTKRKAGADAGEAQDHFSENYNPKYLTSRDLFDLELSDLSFQRHIMVQAWILIDFLLSLTDKAKKRLEAEPEPSNKGLLYEFTLSADDAKWCTDTRQTITEYLQSIPARGNGRFYHRMVETILARDKNWVRWKLESCPSIVRDPVPAEQEVEARAGAKAATRPRRIPDRPPGAIDLSFLEEGRGGGLDALRAPARFTAPTVEQLLDGVRGDRVDLEMAMDDEEKASLENAISNKTWRALRQVRAQNLTLLDQVDPTKDVEDAFKTPPTPPPEEVEEPKLVADEVRVEDEKGAPRPVEASGERLNTDEAEEVVAESAPAVTVTDGEESMQEPSSLSA